MCILLFCQSEICQIGGYQLILVNNRDEYWDRPTKEAHFWGDNQQCISGLDLLPGRVGGTWFGMNKSGKIGALLNILGQMDHTKLGRGHLVSNYIQGSTDINDYAQQVVQDKEKYNGFNLVLFDLGKQEDSFTTKPVYVSNGYGYSSCIHTRTFPANTFIAVSNSPLEYPLQKTIKGKELFGNIIAQYPNTAVKEYLITNLMDLMANRTQFIPDPVLEKAAISAGYNQSRIGQQSAINVWSPDIRYGSRTTTILLVDSQGNVDYIERTVSFSDNCDKTESKIHENFKLTRT